jgi:O-antigen/teichoic acid export membrane protein
LFFNALNNVLLGGLQGLQRMARPAMWEMVRSYVGATVALTLLLNGASLLTFALVFNLACAIPLVANFINLRPTISASSTFDLTLWKRVLTGGFPFFILSALTVFYGTIDIPLLEAFSGHEEVGWYGLAYRWVSMPVFFAASVSLAFFPALSVEGVRPDASFARLANRAMYVVALVAVPAALGIALIARDFLTVLYGAEFQRAIPLMQILALQIPIVGLDMVLGTIVVASDRQRQWVMISVAAAILNPLMNLVAIPVAAEAFGNAAIGAAGVTVLTEVLVLVGALRLRPAGVLDRATAVLVFRIVLAGACMAPVLIALAGSPLAVKILAGATTYGVASLALGTISVREIRGLGTELLRRRQPQTSVVP